MIKKNVLLILGPALKRTASHESHEIPEKPRKVRKAIKIFVALHLQIIRAGAE